MTGTTRRMAASLLLQVVLVGFGAGAALATDDYTLPFYDPGVTMSYGVDRDRTLNRQLDWTGHVWNDGLTHYGRVYDQHTGVDYPMALRSEVAAAKDGTVVDEEGGFGTTQFGAFGNFIRIAHADGRQTLYYHLASAADGGIGVAIGNSVVAGQRIGRSGCSGNCSGAHLHFELLTWSSTANKFMLSDPLAERRWTTRRAASHSTLPMSARATPGRRPFRAARRSRTGSSFATRGVGRGAMRASDASGSRPGALQPMRQPSRPPTGH